MSTTILPFDKSFGDAACHRTTRLQRPACPAPSDDDVGLPATSFAALACDAAALDEFLGDAVSCCMQKELMASILKVLRHWAPHNA